MNITLLQSPLTGTLTTSVFLYALFFGMLGWVIHKLITGVNRRKKSPTSPVHWSWKFWIIDNIDEALLHSTTLFVAVRFAPDLVKYFSPESVDFFKDADHMLIYVVVGWAVSYPINYLKKKLQP